VRFDRQSRYWQLPQSHPIQLNHLIRPTHSSLRIRLNPLPQLLHLPQVIRPIQLMSYQHYQPMNYQRRP
jgi:hypothetical protein